MATKYRRRDGYEQIGRNILVHVSVVETTIGFKLPKGTIVHHVNGIRSDNRKSNLVVCPDAAYHALLHQRMRARDECGNPSWRKCAYCKKYDSPENLYINGRHARHRECFNKAWIDGYYRNKQ